MRMCSCPAQLDFPWCGEPDEKTDAGAFSAPRTVAVSTRFSIVFRLALPDTRYSSTRGGGCCGPDGGPLLGSGCVQEGGGRLRADAPGGRGSTSGGQDVRQLHL